MRKLRYDFGSLEDAFDDALDQNKMSNKHIVTIKRELNHFFNDCNCEQVYYTENTDKMFFGIKVYAKIDSDKIYDYLMGTDDIRLSDYSLEYDSHLFSPVLGLTERELVALTLHEVGHVVNDATPVNDARNYLDEYLAKNHKTLKMSDSYHYREILAYALKDFISKEGSAFYSSSVDEILADDFVRTYGYGPDLESAMEKILTKQHTLYSGTSVDKFSVFMWTMQIYQHLGTRRIGAIRTLNRAKALAGSRLEKAEIENTIRRINRVDDMALLGEAGPVDGINKKIKARMKKMRYDTMRSLEDDFYEFNMRIRNVEDEDDALYLMRQINTRISLIEDYTNSEDLNPTEAKRWNDTLDKFRRIRDELANSMIYKNKSYGLFVAYPEIKENNY